jgi:predicted glycosyltransferase/peptidoglycan/xylan/chitin deacetylase (PgdA/CDA1 family)
MLQDLYYFLKPFVPRRLQIEARRKYVAWRRAGNGHHWPIDPAAARSPEGWPGWPAGKRFALVLTHDVERAEGQARCNELLELEKGLGFRSAFNFVAEDYPVDTELRRRLTEEGFEIGLHGVTHGGNIFKSEKVFQSEAERINRYLKEWGCSGFRAPRMYHDLDKTHHLDIEYDASTFDTDPFEPQPDGVRTIFPFFVENGSPDTGYVELPYTLPQDFTLFVLMGHRDISLWKEKLCWIAEHGGMALIITHPDYMSFGKHNGNIEQYPADYYREFLEHVRTEYEGQYWTALPRDVARYVNQAQHREVKLATAKRAAKRQKIWIDLDNSPHVPLFKPIIDELELRGYDCMVTARDCFQVAGLTALHDVKCTTIGKHYGKHTLLKLFGLVYRGMQLAPAAMKDRPVLALSHGSRSQHLASLLMGIPTIIMNDYEHVKLLPFRDDTWILTPEYIRSWSEKVDPSHVSQYPGLKEDVYVPNFHPDPSILKELGLRPDQLIVTVRPPATEAHYHNPESDRLFEEVMEYFGAMENTAMVILPRNVHQADAIREKWPNLIETRKAVILDQVVDGLNLIWFSDLVISGGGTMNREAAALGVPVYSIFKGTKGGVDKYLAEQGRLVFLDTAADVRTKVDKVRRDKSHNSVPRSKVVLNRIVDEIVRIAESCNSH